MKAIYDGIPVAATSESTLPTGVDGVFETLRIRDGKPQLWDEHWRRFLAGCRWFGFEPPASPDELRSLALSLLQENGVGEGVLRYAAWREGSRTAWRLEANPPRAHMGKPAYRVTAGAPLPPADLDRAFKHLRRTEWTAARAAARASGFDEAILSDGQGRIVEACGSNVFFVNGGVLWTPSLDCGPLPGVMRDKVIALAPQAGFRVRESDCTRQALAEASEIWLTNSLVGITPVSEFDGRTYDAAGQGLARVRKVGERMGLLGAAGGAG